MRNIIDRQTVVISVNFNLLSLLSATPSESVVTLPMNLRFAENELK